MKNVLTAAVLSVLLFSLNANAVLDRVWYSGGWTTTNINSNNYQALAYEGTLAGPTLKVYGTSTNGSGTYDIASTNYGVSYNAPVLAKSENYVELSARPGVQNQWYGLKANGVIDSLYYNGGYPYTVYCNSSTAPLYKAITGDWASNNYLFGARADGSGVDRLIFSGAALVFNDHISNVDYAELETVYGYGNQIFGRTAAGAVNMVFYSNGWQTESVATGYKAIAANADTGYWLFAARSSGAGVDRLHRDANGTWTISDYLLTTKNYDELATVYGFSNQFYGSTIPEPATLAILGLGGLLLGRRRK